MPNTVSRATFERKQSDPMLLAQILAPVAAATVLNAFLGGLAWRATQTEKRSGSPPWYLGAGIVSYGSAAAAFLYAYRGQAVTTSLEIFAASAIAEVFGAAVIYALLHSMFRKDLQPTGQRIFEIGLSVFLLFVVIAGLFA